MNDDELLHLNELASAYLDGDVTAAERARVESSPELQSLVATFGRLRGVLADAPVVAAGTREAAFLAAFAQLDDVAADSSPLTGGVRASVTQLDSRRRWPRVALSAAAGLPRRRVELDVGRAAALVPIPETADVVRRFIREVRDGSIHLGRD